MSGLSCCWEEIKSNKGATTFQTFVLTTLGNIRMSLKFFNHFFAHVSLFWPRQQFLADRFQLFLSHTDLVKGTSLAKKKKLTTRRHWNLRSKGLPKHIHLTKQPSTREVGSWSQCKKAGFDPQVIGQCYPASASQWCRFPHPSLLRRSMLLYRKPLLVLYCLSMRSFMN